MATVTLTPEAKRALAATIRALRERLLRDLRDEAERQYRLSVPIAKAGLDEAHVRRRERLEAWVNKRLRGASSSVDETPKAARERLLLQGTKEAAATLLNRLVLLRHLEALDLSRPHLVTGGWNSAGYQELRGCAPGLAGDETEGYATLLQVVFDELAVDLPGLFGDVGLTRLFTVPPATLREVVARLDDRELQSAWKDDTTLGWVYQFWNDPEREALDAKIAAGGKIEPHEIASKTQMFTERYMVEWLLQNSLGLMWLCICRKNGWTPDAERVLPQLEARRVEWRRKRGAGEVTLDALMPIEGELEEDWKYYVAQPIPPDAVEKAPSGIRDLKVLDPACGSGHFLTSAFDLLARIYREEARHRGVACSDKEIVESILGNNLHGVDIDSRAIQIAAAGLYLKAKQLSPEARLSQMNLVAPSFQVGSLPEDDPALVELRRGLEEEVGIQQALTNRLVSALAGVDRLGTLLRVDAAVKEAAAAPEGAAQQGSLLPGGPPRRRRLTPVEAKDSVLVKLERFLARHSAAIDLGLRLDGEQIASGVRFVRIVKEGKYDLVIGNPPYQALSKTTLSDDVTNCYPLGKADLYAAFLERGLELAREGGLSALLTMRGWMFLGQFSDLRINLLARYDLRSLGDFDRGAFDEVPNEILAVTASVFRRATHPGVPSVATQPTPLDDRSYDRRRTSRKRAAVLAQIGRHEFDPRGFKAIEGEPIVYWWSREFLERYARTPKFRDVCDARSGMSTANNARFLRKPWEISLAEIELVPCSEPARPQLSRQWVPIVMGADGRRWVEPVTDVVNWFLAGLEMKLFQIEIYGSASRRIQSQDKYFVPGIAFTCIGNTFGARAHSFRSIFNQSGSSVFPKDVSSALCLMNSSSAQMVMNSLNPTISFQPGDVARLPMANFPHGAEIFRLLLLSFARHEAARETSVAFRQPGRSSWLFTQAWAQKAVDQSSAEQLRPYTAEYDDPDPALSVSFALGLAIGRFVGTSVSARGKAVPLSLSGGILFLSTEGSDSLDHPACQALHEAWRQYGAQIVEGSDLRTYLRNCFFSSHKRLYENRPIYFPISSARSSYVALVSIHRWKDDTFQVLLADYLVPQKRKLEGELDDIRKARGQNSEERRFTELKKLQEELTTFIENVTQLAEYGPPPADERTPKRGTDARFVMDLDDGVLVNSAALWSLLEPQWKDPKKWWKELATAHGRKDYDWAHLAARYFPKRVRGKCIVDPSLAVAHRCFWELHPAKAYAWEVRLQAEIRAGFNIDEPGSDRARAHFLQQHPDQASEIIAEEQRRRARVAARAQRNDDEEVSPDPLVDQATDDDFHENSDADDALTPARMARVSKHPVRPPPAPRAKRGRRVPTAA